MLPATGEVLRGAVDLAEAAPDELTTIMLVTRLPPLTATATAGGCGPWPARSGTWPRGPT
jgi:hypothetical protein